MPFSLLPRFTTGACLLLASCSIPAFRAKRTVEFSVPTPNAAAIQCESHNGAISVTGWSTPDEVRIKADLSVGGATQSEADDNLQLLEIGTEWEGSTLRVFGKYPKETLSRMSPSFSFAIEAPTRLAVSCTSHNGSIKVRGIDGALKLESHNGGLQGEARGPLAELVTHNGSVNFEFATSGEIQGSVETHNGSIELVFGASTSAVVHASTANGSVRCDRPLQGAEASRSRLRGKLGDGGTGKLVISSHNGSVRLR